MIPDRLLPQTVVIVQRATTTDRYGNEVDDWPSATKLTSPAWIEQQKSSENVDERSGLTSFWLLVVPAVVELSGRDRVEYDGKTFEVVGPPTPRRTPRGAHHTEATLSWIEG